MFTYRLHTADGDDLGQATYPQMTSGERTLAQGERLHWGVSVREPRAAASLFREWGGDCVVEAWRADSLSSLSALRRT
jgi:hypothetical protein